MMEQALKEIIKKLERLQDELHSKNYSSASTLAYEAENQVRFLKDNGAI